MLLHQQAGEEEKAHHAYLSPENRAFIALPAGAMASKKKVRGSTFSHFRCHLRFDATFSHFRCSFGPCPPRGIKVMPQCRTSPPPFPRRKPVLPGRPKTNVHRRRPKAVNMPSRRRSASRLKSNFLLLRISPSSAAHVARRKFGITWPMRRRKRTPPSHATSCIALRR